jgi:hypothetical protein
MNEEENKLRNKENIREIATVPAINEMATDPALKEVPGSGIIKAGMDPNAQKMKKL